MMSETPPPTPTPQAPPPAPAKNEAAVRKPPPLPKSGGTRTQPEKQASALPPTPPATPTTAKPQKGNVKASPSKADKAGTPPSAPVAKATPPVPPNAPVKSAENKPTPKSPPTPPPPPASTAIAEDLAADDSENELVRGYEAEPSRRATVYQLAISLALAAVFSAVPAGLDIAEHFHSEDSLGVSRWAFLLILVAGVQIAYAVYLVQLPDWGSVWVASLLTLGLATVYAMLLGVFLLGKHDSQIVELLGLSSQVHGNKAAGWCVIMLSLSCLLAYMNGRVSVRWYNAFHLLIEAQTPQEH